MQWYLKVLSNYATFTGRSRRKEFWMYALVNCLILMGLTMLSKSSAIGMTPYYLYSVAVFIPGVAVAIRRMHDTNHSGWFYLVPFYNLYLLCKEGDDGPNPHGNNPITERQSTNNNSNNRQSSGVSSNSQSTSSIDSIAQLEKLAELKLKGHLTEEEFETKKKQLLAS